MMEPLEKMIKLLFKIFHAFNSEQKEQTNIKNMSFIAVSHKFTYILIKKHEKKITFFDEHKN